MSGLDLSGLFSALRGQGRRAWLTTLGIAIGGGAIVLLVSLLASGKGALIAANQDVHEGDVIVLRRETPPARDRARARRGLEHEDATMLEGTQSFRETVVLAETSRRTRAKSAGKEKRVSLVGSGPGALDLYRLQVQRGRFLDEEDAASRRRVCVVGAEVHRELLAGAEPSAATSIEIDGEVWTVVGVLADKPMLGATDGTDIWNRRVLVPVTSYDVAYEPRHLRDRVAVRPIRPEPAIEALRSLARRLVVERHAGVADVDEGKGTGRAQEALILGVIQLLLVGTGFVALFVGGINVMNVMLVSVSERTREIGLRRAVGATRWTIARQFLLEAVALTLSGGLLGVVGGVAIAWLAAAVLGTVVPSWSFELPLWSVAVALGASTCTGVAFGTGPAWKAAGLSPVEALRAD